MSRCNGRNDSGPGSSTARRRKATPHTISQTAIAFSAGSETGGVCQHPGSTGSEPLAEDISGGGAGAPVIENVTGPYFPDLERRVKLRHEDEATALGNREWALENHNSL